MDNDGTATHSELLHQAVAANGNSEFQSPSLFEVQTMKFTSVILCAACGCLILGCAPAAPVAATAVRVVAPIVTKFLLDKTMEAFWDSGTKKLRDPEKVKDRLSALEEEIKKTNPEYGVPISELRAKIHANMTWEEYHEVAKGTVDRIELIEMRVGILERDVAALKKRVDDLERKAAFVPPRKDTGPPEGALSTLCLQIPKLPNSRRNLELFVDGELDENTLDSGHSEARLKLLPGDHQIMLKKNGIEVFSGSVNVKKPSEGTTFLPIDLRITGTILVTSSVPPFPKEVVYVHVDGTPIKQWPVASGYIELTVEVGSHVVEVYLRQPGPERRLRVFAPITVLSGQQHALNFQTSQ